MFPCVSSPKPLPCWRLCWVHNKLRHCWNGDFSVSLSVRPWLGTYRRYSRHWKRCRLGSANCCGHARNHHDDGFGGFLPWVWSTFWSGIWSVFAISAIFAAAHRCNLNFVWSNCLDVAGQAAAATNKVIDNWADCPNSNLWCDFLWSVHGYIILVAVSREVCGVAPSNSPYTTNFYKVASQFPSICFKLIIISALARHPIKTLNFHESSVFDFTMATAARWHQRIETRFVDPQPVAPMG